MMSDHPTGSVGLEQAEEEEDDGDFPEEVTVVPILDEVTDANMRRAPPILAIPRDGSGVPYIGMDWHGGKSWTLEQPWTHDTMVEVILPLRDLAELQEAVARPEFIEAVNRILLDRVYGDGWRGHRYLSETCWDYTIMLRDKRIAALEEEVQALRERMSTARVLLQ